MNTNMFTIAFAISYLILYFINEKDPSLISDKMIVYLSISSMLISFADFFSRISNIYVKMISLADETFRRYEEKGYKVSKKKDRYSKFRNSVMYKCYYKILPYVTKLFYIIAFILMILWQPLEIKVIEVSTKTGNSCTFITLCIMFITITINNSYDEYVEKVESINNILRVKELKMIAEKSDREEDCEDKIV